MGFPIIDSSNITKSKIECRYCGDDIEGDSDSDIIIELIYHIHDWHQPTKPINKWEILP